MRAMPWGGLSTVQKGKVLPVVMNKTADNSQMPDGEMLRAYGQKEVMSAASEAETCSSDLSFGTESERTTDLKKRDVQIACFTCRT